jgi:hypothetical protein
MKKGLLAIFLLSFFFAAFSGFALGKRENRAAKNQAKTSGETIMLGRIQVYGNEPHTFVGIVDEHGVEYSIHPPTKEAELRKLQGQLIEFRVIILDEPYGYEGMELGRTLTLFDWKVVK